MITQAVVLVALVSAHGEHAWPTIAPVHRMFRIADARDPSVRLIISGSDGTPLYLLACRGENQTAMPDIIYSGTLDCRLMDAAEGETETNLLVETTNVAAWYSRGRMFPQELSGDCGTYPEYGRIRHFSLRGMRLTLSFENVVFATADQLMRFDLRVDAVPDATATTSIAASCGYLDPHRRAPGRSCSVITKGVEWPRGRRTRG